MTPLSQRHEVTCFLLDGAVVVHMLRPVGVRTFEQYANDIFKPYIMSKLQNAARLDIVFDRYTANSLKSSAREKRGKWKRRRVTATAPMPKNWQDFLRVDANKADLFHYLSSCCVDWVNDGCKELLVTVDSNVLVFPARTIDSIAPCSHEEADTRLFIHVADAVRKGHTKLLIRTVDTDVIALAVSVVHRLDLQELWIEFGTGKNHRYISINDISNAIGALKSSSIPFVHALTGCDTVSSFLGHGKKGAWDTWNSFPAVTPIFAELSSTPGRPNDESITILERFVILLYDKTSICTDINDARKQLFTKKGRAMERLPPSHSALLQHILRAVYQGGIFGARH